MDDTHRRRIPKYFKIAESQERLEERAPSMLALLEKALPIIEEEASRREYAPVEEGEGIGGYWTEMRELANEIAAEIARARKAVTQ